MLDMLRQKMTDSAPAAVSVAGASLACCTMIPPALLFGCRYLTKTCKRTYTPECYQAEVNAGSRLKME